MKLRDLFDISMADFYEIHGNIMTMYSIKEYQINTFAQDYPQLLNMEVEYIKPKLQSNNDVNSDFNFVLGLYVKLQIQK